MTLTSQNLAAHRIGTEVAQHILWHFGDTNIGVQPGHFVSRLMLLLAAADAANFEKLRSLYPEYAAGFELVARSTWGLEHIRDSVKRHVASTVEQLDLAVPDAPQGARYVITRCQSASGRFSCSLAPGHPGPHDAGTGRRWL